MSKKFRALKLWFVIRNYGITGLQKHIREVIIINFVTILDLSFVRLQGVRLAQKIEALLLGDPRFEIPATRHLGLVVFRLVGDNSLTEKLLKRLNSRGNLHCVPAALHDKYVIRFTITSQYTTNDDILKDWREIRNVTNDIFAEIDQEMEMPRARVPLKGTRKIHCDSFDWDVNRFNFK